MNHANLRPQHHLYSPYLASPERQVMFLHVSVWRLIPNPLISDHSIYSRTRPEGTREKGISPSSVASSYNTNRPLHSPNISKPPTNPVPCRCDPSSSCSSSSYFQQVHHFTHAPSLRQQVGTPSQPAAEPSRLSCRASSHLVYAFGPPSIRIFMIRWGLWTDSSISWN